MRNEALLKAGALPVPQLQLGDRSADGVGRERGDPPPVVIGEPQLRTGVRAFASGDDPHPDRPAGVGGGQVAGQLGDLRPVPGLAVGVDRVPPALPGQGGQRVGDRLPGVDAHRVLQAQGGEVVQQRLHAGRGVPAHQHPAADLLGELAQGGVDQGDLVGGVVGVGSALPQQRGQRLTGALRAVVNERQHRVETERALERRASALLLRMRLDDRRVQVHDHRTGGRHRTPMRPGLPPGGGTGSADRRHIAARTGADHDKVEGFVCHANAAPRSVSSRAERGTFPVA